MEGRHYTAVLFIFFGIIQIYSYPQGSASADDATSRKLTLDFKPRDLYLQTMALDDEGVVGRIKRDRDFSLTRPSKNVKENRIMDLTQRGAVAERRAVAVREGVREHQALVNEAEDMLDTYTAGGVTRAEAIRRLDREHPDLAQPFRARNIGSHG